MGVLTDVLGVVFFVVLFDFQGSAPVPAALCAWRLMPATYVHCSNRRYVQDQENIFDAKVQSFAYWTFQVGLYSYAQCLQL